MYQWWILKTEWIIANVLTSNMLSGISLSRVGIILKFLNSGTWKDQEPHNECQQKTTKQGKNSNWKASKDQGEAFNPGQYPENQFKDYMTNGTAPYYQEKCSVIRRLLFALIKHILCNKSIHFWILAEPKCQPSFKRPSLKAKGKNKRTKKKPGAKKTVPHPFIPQLYELESFWLCKLLLADKFTFFLQLVQPEVLRCAGSIFKTVRELEWWTIQ